jgi:hypothetical protein
MKLLFGVAGGFGRINCETDGNGFQKASSGVLIHGKYKRE